MIYLNRKNIWIKILFKFVKTKTNENFVCIVLYDIFFFFLTNKNLFHPRATSTMHFYSVWEKESEEEWQGGAIVCLRFVFKLHCTTQICWHIKSAAKFCKLKVCSSTIHCSSVCQMLNHFSFVLFFSKWRRIENKKTN